MSANDGRQVLMELMDWCLSKNIEELSVFAWSIENWKRTKTEINYVMEQLQNQLQQFIDNPDKRLAFTFVSSDTANISENITEQIRTLTDANEDEAKLHIYIYLSYGFTKGTIKQPILKRDPDLLIRTSGEQRLSNFCMGNLAYTELLFIQPLFPECSKKTWDECLKNFQGRHRRYGE